jgi:hypothetical protein
VTISDEALVAEVRRLAAESPDFVYRRPGRDRASGPECFYVHKTEDGEQVGGCLIGQALINLGVPIDEVAELDTLDIGGAEDVLPQFGIHTHEAVWAGWVQHYQDTGDRWGVAVMKADERVGL